MKTDFEKRVLKVPLRCTKCGGQYTYANSPTTGALINECFTCQGELVPTNFMRKFHVSFFHGTDLRHRSEVNALNELAAGTASKSSWSADPSGTK